MKKLSKIIISLAFIVITAGLLLQIDDDLSPDVEAMLSKVDWQTPSDSYLYFLGIDAELGANPMIIGTEILEEIRDIEVAYTDLQSYDDLRDLKSRPTLTFGDYKSFCNIGDDSSCLAMLFKSNDIPLDSPEMLMAKRRYLHFLNMSNFRTLTEPHILEPFGTFSFLVKGNRLMSLNAISLAQSGQPQVAVNQLYKLIELERRYLRETDTLIARMIAYVLLNETVEVLSVILQQHELEAKSIALLTKEDLSLERVMNRELSFIKSILDSISLDPQYQRWPNWALRSVLKPNMTINAALPNYKNAILKSELPVHQFNGAEHLELESSWFRNARGSLLSKSSQINFDEYIARGFNLNVKLAIFNGILNKPITADSISTIENPYYPGEFDARISEDQKRLCQHGPLNDPQDFRCLSIFAKSQ